ncbi:hypothetical protein PoB_001198900 [Plakobranchus ocellatus]|uniref:Uncharacterized protein n=1 Tax=Plakobranchus ocellatus TaxID=259542 RepID=A0AAV3YQY7_9GAST|nr:hypothetical protein PoB_001198900 [Plakobranchus ocellatus]
MQKRFHSNTLYSLLKSSPLSKVCSAGALSRDCVKWGLGARSERRVGMGVKKRKNKWGGIRRNTLLCMNAQASPQQGDLRLQGPPSGRGADGGARTRDRRVPADLRADSQATVPPSPPYSHE